MYIDPMKRILWVRVLHIVASPLISLWFRSLHIKNLSECPSNDTVLLFWHRHIFAVIAYLSRCSHERAITALVSGSEDGKLLQSLLKEFHFSIVQGSSTGGGFSSLLGMQKELHKGSIVLITPDGPKGPAGKLKPGALFLARYSGKPIVCVHARYHRYWKLSSWDQAILPKPFTSCELIFSEPFFIERNASEFEQTELINTLETTLDGDKTCRRMEESLL